MKFILISFFFHALLYSLATQSTQLEKQQVQAYPVEYSPHVPVKKQALMSSKPRTRANLKLSQENIDQSTQQNQQELLSLNHASAEQGSDIYSYLVGLIYNNRIYPYESIRLKQQGLVTLSFRIDQEGELTEVKILDASSHLLLNQAAVRSLNKIKLNKDMPEVRSLFNRNYSFTFEFKLKKST